MPGDLPQAPAGQAQRADAAGGKPADLTTSLVKYDNPRLVRTRGDEKGGKARSQHEAAFDAILPPRAVEEAGELTVQCLSSTPATRLDVIALQEQLDKLLDERQARPSGICPIREELYAQCLDEVIRQVTLNCAERGLLLLRLRDERRMTVAAYQTLYESGVAFGLRKALQAETQSADLQRRGAAVEAELADLQQQVETWRTKCEALERGRATEVEAEAQRHAEEVAYLERQGRQLKQELDEVLAGKK